MAANIPYSYSSPPILEGWLLKALRLAHSKNPEDLEKLRQLHKDACTDESQVSRITVAEALREQPSETVRPDSQERETIQPTTGSRVRPVLVINTSQPQQSQSSSDATIASPVAQPPSGPSTSVPTTAATTASVVVTKTTSTTSSTTKRTKVAFFNMFDPVSSSGTPSTLRIATPPVAQRTTTDASLPSASVVVDLTESCSSNDSPSKTQPSTDLPSVIPWSSSTSTTPTVTSADLVSPSVIDLTCSPSRPSVEQQQQQQQPTSTRSAPDAQLVASLVADLACCACGKLTRPPQLEPDGLTMNANMLVECVQCGALYHQMCHQPPVLSAIQSIIQQQQQQWRCANCGPQSSATRDTADSHPGSGVGARKRKGGGMSSGSAAYTQGGVSRRL